MDISNAHNSAVINQIRLQFHTSIYGTIMKQLLHIYKNSSFLMTDFRHSTTLRLKVNVSIASEEDILVSNANQPQNAIFVDTNTM